MYTRLSEEQAGLFSTVTSAFIVEVDSQLHPDSGEETAALLRVLIYKIDNTTFGNDVPSLPQWTGPPRTLVCVQAILFASLSASLLSAFLGMFHKQWLNRYESTDMRGSLVERCRNRQWKLDGIETWYFTSVMELSPLLLQTSLLLLGCALSLYLQGIDAATASLVLCVTSSGLFFYLFICVAGATSASCPYQTPGSQLLRYLTRKLHDSAAVITSILRCTFRETIRTIRDNHHRRPSGGIMRFLRGLASEIPRAIFNDARRLSRVVIWVLAILPARLVYHRGHRWSHVAPRQQITSQTTVLDLRCVSWILQASLSGFVHLSALKYLMSVLERAAFDPAHVVDCFNIFIGGIRVSHGRVAITQGLEQLATASAECIYRTFHRLIVIDPTSNTLEDMRRRYRDAFPDGIDFTGFPSRHTMTMINALIKRDEGPRPIWHNDDRPSDKEHIPFARDIAELAQAEHQRALEVPEWILEFAFDSLSLDPMPPASVVANCLEIIAIDSYPYGLDPATRGKGYICFSLIFFLLLTKNSAKVRGASTLTTQELEAMVEDGDQTIGTTLDLALALNRFYIFAVCVRVSFSNRGIPITQEFEQLTTTSAGRFYHTLHRLTATDPTSSILEDIRLRYEGDFPRDIDFTVFPYHHTMTMINALIRRDWGPRSTWHDDDRPSGREHIRFARNMAELTQAEYRREQEVPKWFLDFAFDSLSLDPLPPTPVVTECLKIIAINLGCNVSDIGTLDERYIFSILVDIYLLTRG